MKNIKISQADANALLSIATDISLAMSVNCVKFPYMDADTGLPVGGSMWRDLNTILDKIRGGKETTEDPIPAPAPEVPTEITEEMKAAMAAEAEAAMQALQAGETKQS